MNATSALPLSDQFSWQMADVADGRFASLLPEQCIHGGVAHLAAGQCASAASTPPLLCTLDPSHR